MIIAHNLAASFTGRQLNINTDSKNKSAERLASGYRINRAADDAAGLAISEKMRGQIRGLKQSCRNIQDGISLCNVADGALNEVHAILNRIKELAVQASNDTNTDEDREDIDFEIQALFEVIDDIGTDTEFNGMRVFREIGEEYSDGTIIPSTDSPFFQIMGNDVSQTGYMQEPLEKDYLEKLDNTGMNGGSSNNPFVSVKINFGNLIKPGTDGIKKLIDTDFYVNCCTNCCPNHVKFVDDVGLSRTGDSITIGLKKADGSYFDDPAEFCKAIVFSNLEDNHVEFACDGPLLFIYDIDNNAWSQDQKESAYFCDAPYGNSAGGTSIFEGTYIQAGANSHQSVLLNFGELSVRKLGLYKHNCLDYDNAQRLLFQVDKSNVMLSEQRGRIGAYTNRLEHAYNGNANTHENLQAAESRLRDLDMADEMVMYSKASILEQATTAMLAQANQSLQGVLQLLGQ